TRRCVRRGRECCRSGAVISPTLSNLAGEESMGHRRAFSVQRRAGAVGAMAVGAMAIGATAIGSLAIGAVVMRRVLIRQLVVQDLRVARLRVTELVVESSVRLPEGRGGEATPSRDR